MATAQAAEIIVRGTLEGIREGRHQKVEGRLTLTSLVLEIRPSMFLKGRLPAGSDGLIYLELLARDDDTAARARDRMPEDVEVQAYVRRAPRDGPTFVDAAAGRPEGETLWNPFLPGGLVLRAGQQLYVPYGAWETGELTLDDFAPHQPSWPPFVERPPHET